MNLQLISENFTQFYWLRALDCFIGSAVPVGRREIFMVNESWNTLQKKKLQPQLIDRTVRAHS